MKTKEQKLTSTSSNSDTSAPHSRREFLKLGAGAVGALGVFGGSLAAAQRGLTSGNPARRNKQGAPLPPHTIPDGIYIRIRPLSDRGRRQDSSAFSSWILPKYTAQDILALIAGLKPDILERFTDGRLDPNAPVPVAKGHPPMNVAQFLNAAMKAGAPGCVISPRVSLHEYRAGTIFETAQSLYNFPVNPPMRILSIDNWGDVNKAGFPKDEARVMFEKLKAQGWTDIAVNMVGGVYDPQGFASMVDFGINKDQNFAPNFDALARIKQLDGVKKALLYIDFPQQIKVFMETFTPDQQADHFVNVIAAQQKPHGYTFVWPIVQGKWDSTQIVTSAGGPYKGATIYEVMKKTIGSERKNPAVAG